jgi:3-deoxy-7-phosphoheptulonate synthase
MSSVSPISTANGHHSPKAVLNRSDSPSFGKQSPAQIQVADDGDTDDTRVASYDPLISPAMLSEDYPISEVASRTVSVTRAALSKILKDQDDRLVVIVGPCSIHDIELAKDYGKQLRFILW